jgi:3-phenylpropionate/trans-cinnamate dioxygenase ferredoxin component
VSAQRLVPESSFSRVLNVSEVPPGTKKAVDVAGKSILVCHLNDRLYAVSNICSHAQEKLECGRMSRGWIACPTHGARFELATGRAMNPPAKQPIATYEIRVVEDWIEILV